MVFCTATEESNKEEISPLSKSHLSYLKMCIQFKEYDLMVPRRIR
jgi:hypothetical protein